MTTPRTGRDRGRPKGSFKSLLTDPDRYALAYANALIATGACTSEARAFEIALVPSAFHNPIPISRTIGSETWHGHSFGPLTARGVPARWPPRPGKKARKTWTFSRSRQAQKKECKTSYGPR